MPAKISQNDVVRQLYVEYICGSCGYTAEQTAPEEVPITYRRFIFAMMADDFISSAPTIKAKWNGLIASGIIAPTTKGDRGLIDTKRVAVIVGMKKTKTKTNTLTASISESIPEGAQ